MAKLIFKAQYYSPVSKTPEGKTRGSYASYIATRDGVEIVSRSGMAEYVDARKGSHGLFSDEGVAIDMEKVCDEVDSVDGNVWGLIFSLKREDAERLGYNTAEQWMQLLRSRRNDISKEMHIEPGNLRWYAAYHNHVDHPHVHMLVWSDRAKEAYLDRNGIHNIKQTIAGDIFRQEMYCVYQRQTEHRDVIRRDFRERMREIVLQINGASFDNPVLEQMLILLSEKLKKVKGKKKYGYLDRHTKKAVDEIVRCIANDDKIKELYELWYQSKCETFRTYTDVMPEKEPIENCAEFKPIRNAVVTLASDITALPDMKESSYHYGYVPREFSQAEIADAKKLITEDRYDDAWKLLVSAYTNGNSYAYAFLGDCLCLGRYWYADRDRGMWFLTSAADKGNSYAMYRLGLENLKDDKDEAEYWFKKAAEYGVVNAMYSLYRLYKDGDVKPNSSADKLQYLRKSAEAGFKAAEYEYSKYLKEKNPELSLEYLKRSAERGFADAMYTYGKMLIESGDDEGGLAYLEKAAERNTWIRSQLALLYLYKYDNYEKFKEHIESAASDGDPFADSVIKHYNADRNMKIVTGVANLFYYAGSIFEDSAAKDDPAQTWDGVDSKLKREIEQKKRGEMKMV